MKIYIKDYTVTPGMRYESEGKYSGEEYRETILIPKFTECMNKKDKLIVNLDGLYGYPSSFLEEAFGGLSRKFGKKLVKSIISIECYDDESQIDRIKRYIEGK